MSVCVGGWAGGAREVCEGGGKGTHPVGVVGVLGPRTRQNGLQTILTQGLWHLVWDGFDQKSAAHEMADALMLWVCLYHTRPYDAGLRDGGPSTASLCCAVVLCAAVG
jgi:hypothetical protein